MKELQDKITEAFKRARKINPDNKNSDSKLNKLSEELLDQIHMSYDPIKVLQEMIRNDIGIYDSLKEAISINFKNLILFDEYNSSVCLDVSNVNFIANNAAANFLDLFSGINKKEKEVV